MPHICIGRSFFPSALLTPEHVWSFERWKKGGPAHKRSFPDWLRLQSKVTVLCLSASVSALVAAQTQDRVASADVKRLDVEHSFVAAGGDDAGDWQGEDGVDGATAAFPPVGLECLLQCTH